jgi:LPXTG-motif cell wall-anchored protein
VSAQGAPEDKRLFFTFSGPVAVPGVTLPAGKYLFRLPTSVASGERHVMQVLSADGKNSYAMFFGISASRTDFPAKPEIRFMETAAGMPAAVKTWWYPGDKAGYEFIYPKEQARLLAKGTGQPVLIAVAERVTPAGTETAVVPAPAAVPEGPAVIGELAPLAMPVYEPPLEARADLPKTASDTFVILLAGAGLLLGAALVKGLRTTLE